jgi:hypothetical protein
LLTPLVDILPQGAYLKSKSKGENQQANPFIREPQEPAMELYVPNFQLKEVSEALAGEGVAFEVTGNTSTLVLGGKASYEVTEVKVNLLETEVPSIYDIDSPRKLRAYRLPSGQKLLLTDANGNFERLVAPPPGWER